VARPDPYRNFRFRIEIGQIQYGGFQSVSGLERRSEIEPYREGGINDHERQLVVKTTYPPLTLKRGLFDTDLWDWHQEVINGRVQRQEVAIVLRDDKNEDVWRWLCADAFPSKWTGAELDAEAGAVATETVEIVHHGIRT